MTPDAGESITRVNERAPVLSRAALEVDAAPDALWEIMSDFERWPTWNRDVSAVRIHGPVEPGTRFEWKAGPGTIKSTLRTVRRPSVLAWTGSTFGIQAIHVWTIEALATDRSRIAIEESWDGLLARLLRGSFQKQLDTSCSDGLRMIKAEAEKRVARAAS